MLPSNFLRRQDNRSARRRQANRRRLFLESLEGRQLLSTFSVINTKDSGSGSLRQAILSSNASKGSAVNTISFDIGSGGLETISLKSALPAITHPVVIDGSTQPGTGTTPRIVLSGSGAGSSAVGLSLQASSSTVKGLVIDSFGGAGILVSGASNDTITDDYIGVTAAGNVAAGNGGNGIHFTSGASKNVVSDDVISANGAHGVNLDDGSDGNTVEGSAIGTDVSGAKPLGNADSGVYVEQGSNANTIGGSVTGAGNTISANKGRGVFLDTGSEGNVVEGNMIGTDVSGTLPLGNGDSGVRVADGANNNVIGGTTAGARNIISANKNRGIDIDDGTSSTLEEGNYIGTDVTGTKPLGNVDSGVMIENASNGNIIGGTAPGAGNVLSGNQLRGVRIDTGSMHNVVEGNMIGTDYTGTKPLGNGDSGVLITNGSDDNVVGGTTPAARNVISANQNYGVHIDEGSAGNDVEGNYLGTDVSGANPLGNADSGVLVTNGSKNNVIGGIIPGAGNVISGNKINGIHIDSGSQGNLVEGNDIGTTAGGGSALGNGQNGVLITGGSSNNTVGGASPADANVISDNKGNGVQLNGAGKGNLVEGDTIESNTTNGVDVDNSSSTTVSNTTSEYNLGWGILVTGSSNVTLTNNKTAHNGLGGVKG